MFYCKNENCNTELKSNGADSRQEWCEEFYSCPKCDETYTLRTEYKMQSHVIESQKLIQDSTGKAVE